MRLLLFLFALTSSIANAGTMIRVFENASAPAEYRYLRLFANSSAGNNQSGYLTLGEADSYHLYPVTSNINYLVDRTEKLEDENTRVELSLVKFNGDLETLKVEVIDLTTSNTVLSAEYQEVVTTTPNLAQPTALLDAKVEAEFLKYRLMDDPADLVEMRRLWRQLMIDFGGDSVLNQGILASPLARYDLQIWSDIGYSRPDAELAKVTLPLSDQDIVSKKYLKAGETWYESSTYASAALDEALDFEATAPNEKSSRADQAFSSYTDHIQQIGLHYRLQNALEKFATVQIEQTYGFWCEDAKYTWTHTSWILKDGTVLEYKPQTECD